MKHLLDHVLQILVWGLVLLFMINVPFYNIPYIHKTMMILILLLCGIWVYFGFKKFPRSMKRGKKVGIIFVLGVLLCSFPLQAEELLQAGEFCSWAEKYHEETFNATKKKGKDKPCEADKDLVECDDDVPCSKRDKVRQELNKLRKSPSVFVPSDKLTAQEQKQWRSFRQDSHWATWVAENYGDLVNSEEMACAAMYASLCSEYERRHPDTRAKTVTEIMQRETKEFGCWPCKMAYITLTVVQGMSSDLEENMREAGINVLKILMLLWLLYTVSLAVVFPSKGATFLKDLLYRILCVMISALILSSGDTLNDLYKSVLSPIVSLGLGVSEGISESLDKTSFPFADASGTSTFSFAETVRSAVGIDSISSDYCSISITESDETDNNPWNQVMKNILPGLGVAYPGLQNKKYSLITPELQTNLLCLTQKMYRQVSPVTSVGHSLMSFSFAGGSTFFGMTIPVVPMFLVGLLLVVFFSIFSFLVAFKIIDIFLRMGFILVLIPLFVATWAFPWTRGFTKKGFLFLMGIVTEFLGLVLALNFIMLILEAGIMKNKTSLIKAMIAPYSKNYGDNLFNAITENGGWAFLFMLCALFFVGVQLLSACTSMIGELFDTKSAASLGGDLTGAATASFLQQSAQKLWKPASEASEKVKPYEVENGKSAPYLAGRAVGRLLTGQNPLRGETPAAPQRYFGEQTGNNVKRASQYLASGIDKVGIGVGQTLSKTGIGAIVGVPLTLASKTLSVGVRATGKLASGLVKTPGAVVHGAGKVSHAVMHPGETLKKIPKAAGKVVSWAAKGVGDTFLYVPKKIIDEIKKGTDDGKK